MEAPKPARAGAFRRSPMSSSQAESPTKSAEPRTRPAWMRQATSPSGGQQTCGCARHSTSLLFLSALYKQPVDSVWRRRQQAPRQKPKTPLSQRPKASAEDGMRRLQARPKLGTADRRCLPPTPPAAAIAACRISKVQPGGHWPAHACQQVPGARRQAAGRLPASGCHSRSKGVCAMVARHCFRLKPLGSGSPHLVSVASIGPTGGQAGGMRGGGWMVGWMDGRAHGWIDDWMYGCMDGLVDGPMDGRLGGWTDGWMAG